jgi:FMN phosphatase YigB (HAD superfamily)
MALTLRQYVEYLESRDLPWPAPPQIDPPDTQPRLVRLRDIRAVTWNIYGTLLAIAGGELLFEHPDAFLMETALDKTIQEFKMWGAMSRKPGQPSEYLHQIYRNLLIEHRTQPSGGEKYPEVQADRLWESCIKKLMQKDYRFDAAFYGSLNEYSRKVALFFHASLQGTICYPGAAAALGRVRKAGLRQGLLADAQCFTAIQLERGLQQQDSEAIFDRLVDQDLRAYSYEVRARKPSERLFRPVLAVLGERGISPRQILHVGARPAQDLLPARRLGMRTALFAAGKQAPLAEKAPLKELSSGPDVILTQLEQIADVVG